MAESELERLGVDYATKTLDFIELLHREFESWAAAEAFLRAEGHPMNEHQWQVLRLAWETT